MKKTHDHIIIFTNAIVKSIKMIISYCSPNTNNRAVVADV